MVEGIGGRSFPIRTPQELPDPMPAPRELPGPSRMPQTSHGSSPAGEVSSPGAGHAAANAEGGFGASMNRFLGEVNDLQLRSDGLFQSFVRGETPDLHQVVLAQQEAAIAVRLVTEMRDRLLQSYQEIMRMTV